MQKLRLHPSPCWSPIFHLGRTTLIIQLSVHGRRHLYHGWPVEWLLFTKHSSSPEAPIQWPGIPENSEIHGWDRLAAGTPGVSHIRVPDLCPRYCMLWIQFPAHIDPKREWTMARCLCYCQTHVNPKRGSTLLAAASPGSGYGGPLGSERVQGRFCLSLALCHSIFHRNQEISYSLLLKGFAVMYL